MTDKEMAESIMKNEYENLCDEGFKDSWQVYQSAWIKATSYADFIHTRTSPAIAQPVPVADAPEMPKDQIKEMDAALLEMAQAFLARNMGWPRDTDFDGKLPRCHKAIAAVCESYIATRAAPTPSRQIAITLDFKQATELLAMFGGEPSSITLLIGEGHSGKGVYAHYTDYPEEGAEYLGVTDEEQSPAPVAPIPAHIDRSMQEQYGHRLVAGLQRWDRASPPQARDAAERQPLTDTHLCVILAGIDPETKRLPPGFREFAHAIEAAHGIRP